MGISNTTKVILLITAFLLGRIIRRRFAALSCPADSRNIIYPLSYLSSDSSNCEASLCNPEGLHPLWPMHLIPATVPQDIFSHLHHPSTPAKLSILINSKQESPDRDNVYRDCDELYMTRTGSRSNQPNKCVAVAKIPDGMQSIVQLAHRIGVTALTLDQYQKDFPRAESGSFTEEKELLPSLLNDMHRLHEEFLTKMGQPLDENGKRKNVIVMVANEGVMDLLLNFICSAEQINMDIGSIVVFIGDKRQAVLIESMGAKAIYSESLGSMPAEAAGGYLDKTFSRMMWFKVTSVYLALRSGFNVLFQDTDLVWLKNPMPYLEEFPGDIIFMDDGARTPRYTPLFTNSGFYYLKYNQKTLYFQERMAKGGPSEIAYSHSHQQVLTRHLAESLNLFGLDISVLDAELFPSGQAYHENKPLMNKIIEKRYRPYVFHMCWTDNRVNKVVYFKEIGLWYLPEDNSCTAADQMLSLAELASKEGTANHIRNKCCLRSKYWPKE